MTELGRIRRRSFLIGAASLAASVKSGLAGVIEGKPNSPSYGSIKDRSETRSARIGNINAFMPGGIAFIQDNEFGIVLNIGWNASNKPGIASPDCSFNRIGFRKDKAKVQFDWGRIAESDCVAIRLVSDRAVELILSIPARPWHAINAVVRPVDAHHVEAICLGLRGDQRTWTMTSDAEIVNAGDIMGPAGDLRVTLKAETPVHIIAGFGDLPKLEVVDRVLDEAAANYSAKRASVECEHGDFVAAICDNMNNSRMYSNISKEVVHVIGRGSWLVTDPDYLPYFVWDTSFNSMLASLEDPEGATTSLRTLLSYQRPDGMLPRILNWNHDPEPFVNLKNSNPPVSSLCAWRIYERWPDIDFVKEIYPRLLRAHDWWPKYRDGNSNGLLEWGSIGTLGDAVLETGWDDTPAFDGAKLVGTNMNADAVDLNALWVMDAECLAKMADLLGLFGDSRRLRLEIERTNKLINEILWNDDLGIYCHRLWDDREKPGKFLARLTPMNFYPLICGAPDEERARRMIRTLTNDRMFWGTWPIPTLPYSDPDWSKQDYWKGHTWPPTNYLVFQGVKRYCTPRQQYELAERSVKMFMQNWTAHGTCNETYNSTDGSGDRFPHYSWGALMCQIGIEALIDANPSGPPSVRQGAEFWGDFTMKGIPSGGKLYRVSSKAGIVSVEASG